MPDNGNPNPPNPPTAVLLEHSVSEQYVKIDARVLADMSPTNAAALVQVSKNTYAVPARQETVRLAIAAAVVAGLLYFLVPALLAANPSPKILAVVILGSVGILSADRIIKAAFDALKSH
ncbi:hypothetical protein [Candidatus Binatus sp.]|uniref:hypothetical protein n=1 Tax=Candidatus Binatus sp. TaxID=2811406 RepID=UPI003BAEEFAF